MNYSSILTTDDKPIFVDTLCHLAACDGSFDDGEFLFIESLCLAIDTPKPPSKNAKNLEQILDEVQKISSPKAAHHLIKEMFFIAHSDGDLSDDEIIAISQIGLAMNVSLEEIQVISEWVIDELEDNLE